VADGKSEISGAGGARGDVSLGKLLTEARKNGGFTSEQVAAETHIPPHYIKAIETDDYGMISDQLYLLPFLRRYAAFIGLDPEDVASRFVREVQKAESSAAKASEPIPMITTERRSGEGGRYGFAIVVLLILAGLAALLAWKRQALMQHVMHFSKRTSFSSEPVASPSPAAAQASESAASRASETAPASAASSAAAESGDSTQSSVSGSKVTPAPRPESSPAPEPALPPPDDSNSIE